MPPMTIILVLSRTWGCHVIGTIRVPIMIYLMISIQFINTTIIIVVV